MSSVVSAAPTSKRGPQSGLLAAIAEAQANNASPDEPVELNLSTGGDPNADDPSFRRRQSFDAEDCQANDLSFGQQRQCIDAGFLDDPSFRKRQSFDAEDCQSNDLSFGQQRQCIDASLLDDPSF
ncbi:hypothetical protein UCRNP2_6295 [Neofusicoccum parvum UCRNP2]|uniref:Uncharacterized protein n=1 Tax=Botryosphaeria parva (strain UCR-NP2) TaxID=1287680 RepID=R1GFG6_BOTPV|nr:hypothetical protein UCRNP2_6295 [Neofusicoccum parvum UCRNP2]